MWTMKITPAVAMAPKEQLNNLISSDMSQLELDINAAKSRYDKPYLLDRAGFSKVSLAIEHGSIAKAILRKKNMKVTNAWLKAYEMFNHYSLLQDDSVYFDNAAFPGAFIKAAQRVSSDNGTTLNWFASSLLDQSEDTTTPLADTYGLYKRNPSRWMMTKSNNGDVIKWSNQLDFKSRLGGMVDVYTSDLGFGIGKDYLKQEELQSRANLGQIVAGLMTLKSGGSMITKQYTIFLPISVSIIAALTTLFDRVEICKPLFSKPANSEIYVVCIGFKGPAVFMNSQIYAAMKNVLQNWNDTSKVVFGLASTEAKHVDNTKQSEDNKSFYADICAAREYLGQLQINSINEIIDTYNSVKSQNSDIRKSPLYLKNRKIVTEWIELTKV